MDLLGQAFNRVMSFDNETPRLLAYIAELVAAPDQTGHLIVDVGCGRGRILRELVRLRYNAIGIEINQALVAENRAAGLQCLTPDQWDSQTGDCDVLIMAHVIEHFAPADLLVFMERHLARLRPGGHLLIATPLMSDYFYDDFDHVKPYQPVGLQMVFGGAGAQVQYYARHRLELADLWYRRSPLRPCFHRGLHLRTPSRYFWGLAAVLGVGAFRLSGGLVGRTDGWIGVFRKLG